jgi:hypothetical protein
MMFPLVRDLAAPTALLRVPVTVTCRVLGFSTQGFYKWLANPVCQRDWDDAHLINAAMNLHGDDPEFGYRLLTDELRLNGFTASENRVWRLCSQQQIFSVHSRKRGLHRKPGPPVHDDLLDRDFTAETPNTKWLTEPPWVAWRLLTLETRMGPWGTKAHLESRRLVGTHQRTRPERSGLSGSCARSSARATGRSGGSQTRSAAGWSRCGPGSSRPTSTTVSSLV